jgi:hypothetical protein
LIAHRNSIRHVSVLDFVSLMLTCGLSKHLLTTM